MKDAWQRQIEQLLLNVRNERELRLLLQDLLTPAEQRIIAERWQIVQRLLKGDTHRMACREVKSGIATISRAARVLEYGTGAFRKHYQRLFGPLPSRS